MDVCVTGVTGFVGSRLVPALLETGHDVTVLVRDEERYRREHPAAAAEVRVVEGDLLDPWSFDAALDVDAAYYLVHSMGASGAFAEKDRRAAHNFQRAADAAGVERVVYLGGLGGEDEQLSEHLRSRREVEFALADGDYDLTTLRAAVIVGAGSASFAIVTQLARKLPLMLTPRWVRTPCQPIAIADVVEYLVGVLDTPETAGETYEIGGPDVLTYEAMLERTARLLGRRLYVVPVPVLSPSLSAHWIDLVTDVPAGVANPLIKGLRNPVVVTDDRIDSVLGPAETTFDEAVERALREEDMLPGTDGDAPDGPETESLPVEGE
jgi:uncharacterized protein YbjT (DUF2867 family)